MPVLKIKKNGKWIEVSGGGGGGSVPVEIEDIVTIDLDGAVEGSPNAINADTLGGRAASEYATENYVDIKIAEAQLGGEVDLSEYATKEDLSGFITEIPSEYVTESELDTKGYLTEHQSLTDYAKKSEIPNVSAFQTAE